MSIIEGLGYFAVVAIAIVCGFISQNMFVGLIIAFIGCQIIFEITP